MKKVTWCILICMIAAFVIAAEGQKQPQDVQKEITPNQKNVPPGLNKSVPTRRSQSRNRQQMYEQRLARLAETHAKGIAELEAIKKIAKEEGAVKTIAALEALITKKNTQFKESMAKVERQRKQREEQLQKRQAEGRPQQTDLQKEAVEKPDK